MKTAFLGLALVVAVSTAAQASYRDRTPDESRFGFAADERAMTAGATTELPAQGLVATEAAGISAPAAGQNDDPNRFNWGGRS